MRSATYCGQDLKGWDFIGTEKFKLPITEDMDVQATVEKLQRALGDDVFLLVYADEHR